MLGGDWQELDSNDVKAEIGRRGGVLTTTGPKLEHATGRRTSQSHHGGGQVAVLLADVAKVVIGDPAVLPCVERFNPFHSSTCALSVNFLWPDRDRRLSRTASINV
jgi:hypothetical protein